MQRDTDSTAPAPRTLLYIDERVPTFDRDAGSAVTHEYLKLLSEIGFKVTFWPHDRAAPEPYASALREEGVEISAGKSDLRDYLTRYGSRLDVLCLAGPDVAVEHLDAIDTLTRTRVLYIAHDLHFLQFHRMAEVVGGLRPRWLTWRMERIEWNVMRRCDTTVVFSTVEEELLRELEPSLDVVTWPWIQEAVGEGPAFGERSGLLFVGRFAHSPNEDAVLWFAREVLPIIRNALPDARFVVVGDDPPKKVTALRSSKVTVTGFVPNVSKYLEAARVFVAPLRFGAGVKGKILTAMAHGLPTVTTSIGAEGIGIENESEVLVADSPEDFAEAVVTVHEQYAFWKRLSRASLDFVRGKASREHARAVVAAQLGIEREA